MQKPAGWAAGPWRAAAIAVMAAAAVALGGAHEALAVTVNPGQSPADIRAAIEAEPDGGTVTFAAGTYDDLGNVAIISDVTLEPAAGADVTLTGEVSFNILSSGVTIRGLTFHNTNSPGTGPGYIDYTNNRHTGVIVLGYDPVRYPVMSAADAGSSLDNIEIRNNTITRTNWHGILFRPYNEATPVTYSNIVIADNVIDEIAVRGPGNANQRGLTGAIHGSEWRAVPAAITGLDISNNVISRSKTAAIAVANAGGTITGNTISRPGTNGIMVDIGADGLTVEGNTVTGRGSGTAFTVSVAAVNTVIRENTIENVRVGLLFCNDGRGCFGNIGTPISPTLLVNENSFVGTVEDVSNNAVRGPNAERNYFDGEIRTARFPDVFPYYTSEERGAEHLTQSKDFTESPGVEIPFTGRIDLGNGIASAFNRTLSVDIDSVARGIELYVNITHAESDDLIVGLEAPDGTYELLGFVNSRVDTQSRIRHSTTDYDSTGGRFVDDELRRLLGKPTRGDWKLVLGDRDDNGRQGTLNSWTLSLAADPDLSKIIVARPDEHSTGRGAATVIPVLSNDAIPSGTNANVTVAAQPPNGVATVNSAPGAGDTITYDPDDDFAGIDRFTYRVENQDGSLADEATVEVTVGSFYLRDIPDQAANELAPFSYPIPHENPGGTALTWSIASSPADLTNDGDGDPKVVAGTFTWTPSEEDGDGTQREFVIEASAGGESHSKTLRVTAREVNSPPAFSESLDASYVAAQGVPFTLDVTAGDPDRPAQDLRYRIAGTIAGQAPPPSLNGQGLDVTAPQSEAVELAWTPENPGTFDLEIRVDDGVAPAVIRTAQVEVPAHPADINTTSIDPDTITVQTTGRYDGPYDVRVLDPGGALVHSYNVPGNAPASSEQVDLAENGIYTIQADVAGGADKWGRDSTVTTVFVHPDNHRTEYADSVSANAANLPSAISQTVGEISLGFRLPLLFGVTSPTLPVAKIEPGESVNIDVGQSVVTDPAGLPFTVEVTSRPPDSSTEVFANGTIRYTTGATQRSTDVIEYEVRVGSEVTDAAHVVARVVVFEAPDIETGAIPGISSPVDILDYLPDGTVIEFPSGTLPHENGTLSIGESGFRLDTPANYTGTSRFGYTATYGGASEAGSITMHYFAPEIRVEELVRFYYTARPSEFLVDVNNTRPHVWPPGELVWVVTVVGEARSGVEFGVDDDGIVSWNGTAELESQSVNITASVQNQQAAGQDAPTAPPYLLTVIEYDEIAFGPQTHMRPGPGSFNYDVDFTNNDKAPISWELAESPVPGARMLENGTFTWAPDDGHNNKAFEFRVGYSVGNETSVASPADSREAVLRVEVGVQNHHPAVEILTAEREFDEHTLVMLNVTVDDEDDDSHTWTVTGNLPDGGPPECTTVPPVMGYCFDPITTAFYWKTEEMDDGTYTLTFNATDMGGAGGEIIRSNSTTATITVREVNQSPVADYHPVVRQEPEEGEEHSFVIMPTIRDDDHDEDGPDMATISSVVGATSGAAWRNPENLTTQIIYEPENKDWNGNAIVTYIVLDRDGLQATGMINITITPRNDPPVLAGIAPVTVDEGSPVVINASATDPDLDYGDALTYTFESDVPLPAGSYAFDNATGVLTWDTGEDDDGARTITFTVEDAEGETDMTAVGVTVNEIIDFALNAGAAGALSAEWGGESGRTTHVLEGSGSCVGTGGMGVRGVAVSASPWTDGPAEYGGITTWASMAGNATLGPLLVPTGAEGEANPAVFRLDAPPAGGRMEVTLHADLAAEQARTAGASLAQTITYRAFCY